MSFNAPSLVHHNSSSFSNRIQAEHLAAIDYAASATIRRAR